VILKRFFTLDFVFILGILRFLLVGIPLFRVKMPCGNQKAPLPIKANAELALFKPPWHALPGDRARLYRHAPA
jgi:hypothetical protein